MNYGQRSLFSEKPRTVTTTEPGTPNRPYGPRESFGGVMSGGRLFPATRRMHCTTRERSNSIGLVHGFGQALNGVSIEPLGGKQRFPRLWFFYQTPTPSGDPLAEVPCEN